MFGSKPLVEALPDRLRHQCITIRIDGYRYASRCSAPRPAHRRPPNL
jgi:hypothetical protein